MAIHSIQAATQEEVLINEKSYLVDIKLSIEVNVYTGADKEVGPVCGWDIASAFDLEVGEIQHWDPVEGIYLEVDPEGVFLKEVRVMLEDTLPDIASSYVDSLSIKPWDN